MGLSEDVCQTPSLVDVYQNLKTYAAVRHSATCLSYHLGKHERCRTRAERASLTILFEVDLGVVLDTRCVALQFSHPSEFAYR